MMTGQDLQKAIRRLGHTQREFADRIGMSEEFISRMCCDHKPIARRTELLVTEWLRVADVEWKERSAAVTPIPSRSTAA